MSSSRRTVGRAIKHAAVTVDRLRTPAPGIVVLVYHRVGRRSTSEVDLDTEVFAAQMAYLAEQTDVVRLGDAIGLLARRGVPTPFSGRPQVVVTFDDGTDDFVDIAVPILDRYRVPVTMYLATSFVDEGVPFSDGGRPASWSGLADAITTGMVDIGSHTHRHRLLDRLPTPEIADELDRSTRLIADHLDCVAADFAYPKAVFGSPAAADAVRSRFRSAAVAGTHANVYGATDPYRLARSPIQVGDEMRFFRRKAAGGMRVEDTMRRALNRVRYAGLRS